jgi:hypothetical protein
VKRRPVGAGSSPLGFASYLGALNRGFTIRADGNDHRRASEIWNRLVGEMILILGLDTDPRHMLCIESG